MVQINSGINQTNKINPNLKIHCLSGLATYYLYYVFKLCSARRGLQVIQGNFAFALSFCWYLIWKFCVFDAVYTLLFRRYSPAETLQRCRAVKSVLWRFGYTSGPFHGDLSWRLISRCTTISTEWNTLPVRRWMTANVGSFTPKREHWNGASSFTLKSLLSEQNVLLQFSCFCMWTNGKIVMKTSWASAAGVWPTSGVGERGQDHPRAESSCFRHDPRKFLDKYINTRYHPPEACFR